MWSTLPPNLAALAFEFVALEDVAAAKPVAKFVAAAARHALTRGQWRSLAVCANDGAAIARGADDASSFRDAWRRLPLRDAWLVDAEALVEIVTPWVARYDFVTIVSQERVSRGAQVLDNFGNKVPGIKWHGETDPSVRLDFLRMVEPEVTRLSGRRIVGPLWRWCTEEPYPEIKYYGGPRVSSIDTLSKVLKAWAGAYPGPDGEPRPMEFIADIVHGLGQWPPPNGRFTEMLAYEFLSADLIGLPGVHVGPSKFNWDFILWVVAQLRPDIRRKYRLNEAGFEIPYESDSDDGGRDEDYSTAFIAVFEQLTLGWKDRDKAFNFVGHYVIHGVD